MESFLSGFACCEGGWGREDPCGLDHNFFFFTFLEFHFFRAKKASKEVLEKEKFQKKKQSIFGLILGFGWKFE